MNSPYAHLGNSKHSLYVYRAGLELCHQHRQEKDASTYHVMRLGEAGAGLVCESSKRGRAYEACHFYYEDTSKGSFLEVINL